jgi:predicted exporter
MARPRRPKQPSALKQAEALQEQLEALESALNRMHSLQIVYWPSGDIFRASGTAPDTVEALTATKAALQNAIGQVDTQIVEAATAKALADQQALSEPAPEAPQEE